jgi:hypothetical protein
MTRLFPTIETSRLVLRQPGDAEASGLLCALQDEAVLRYFGTKPLQTEQDALVDRLSYTIQCTARALANNPLS